MAATPARPESAEYITAVDQLTQLIRETDRYSIIDDHPRIEGMFNAVHEFQERFPVGLEVGLNITLQIDVDNNYGNYYSGGVPELQSVFLAFWSWPGPESACRRLISQHIDNFMEEEALAQEVSITELLEDDKVGGGQCSICLSQFVFVAAEEKSSNKALVSATTNNEEGEEEQTDDSTAASVAATVAALVHVAENSESQTVDIPFRLPCGHVYGKDCIRSWLSVCLVGNGQQPTCPVCRSKLEGLDDASTLFKRLFYTEVIKLLS